MVYVLTNVSRQAVSAILCPMLSKRERCVHTVVQQYDEWVTERLLRGRQLGRSPYMHDTGSPSGRWTVHCLGSFSQGCWSVLIFCLVCSVLSARPGPSSRFGVTAHQQAQLWRAVISNWRCWHVWSSLFRLLLIDYNLALLSGCETWSLTLKEEYRLRLF
jgi:hypothetical protein